MRFPWTKQRREPAYPPGSIATYLRIEDAVIREYVENFQTVYIAPASVGAERAASELYRNLTISGRPPDVVYATFNHRVPHLQVVDNRERPDETAGLVVIDYERDSRPEMRRRLQSPRLFEDFIVREVFYTWYFPHAGHEILHTQPYDELDNVDTG